MPSRTSEDSLLGRGDAPMAFSQSNQVFTPRTYDIFVGLDVDKASISATVLDQERGIRSMRIPYDADNLLSFVRRQFPREKVVFAYEAGPTGYGLYDKLIAGGYPCLVVAPAMVPSAPGRHVKTNRLDSQKIAEGLRGGQLRSIHVPSGPYRELRHLMQLRDTFVRQATATKCRIKALLLFEGISFPAEPTSPQWTQKILTRLKELQCQGAVRFKLDSLISGLQFSRQEVLRTTKEIRRFCMEDPELQRCLNYLTSIPGIGQITASQLLSRIGDWRELKNVRQLGAFLGMVPSENSTGDEVRRGSITRAGDNRTRNKLIQCAWAAIRKDPELDTFYRRIFIRHHKDCAAKKAIVAVARKMTMRIYAVLHEQRPYEVRPANFPALMPQEETTCPGDGSITRRTQGGPPPLKVRSRRQSPRG